MSSIKLPQGCPSCDGPLTLERLRCQRCSTLVEGAFWLPRLARLTRDEQYFLEVLTLSSGSLKMVSKTLGISYPTVRKRLDAIVDRLEAEIKRDDKARDQPLKEPKA